MDWRVRPSPELAGLMRPRKNWTLRALSVGALLCAFDVGLLAQDVRCVASSSPRLVRAEGYAELVGDLMLTFTGGTPGNTFWISVTVSLNTNITSNILGGPVTDALLLIDDPGPASQVLCGSQPCNICRAGRVSNNTVTWGLTFSPPGGTGTRRFRITNLRAAPAQAWPQPSNAPLPVVAAVTITRIIGSPIPVESSDQTVAYAVRGLDFSADVANFTTCEDPEGKSGFTARFRESFPDAFRKRIEVNAGGNPVNQNVPGWPYHTESGFVNTAVTGIAGQATHGTRLVVFLTGVPPNVQLTLSNHIYASQRGQLTARRYTAFDAGFSGGSPSADKTISISGGTAIVVFEIEGAADVTDSGIINEFRIQFLVDYTGGPVEAGIVRVKGVLGPLNSTETMSDVAPEPRFRDDGTEVNAFSIAACSTQLLFPQFGDGAVGDAFLGSEVIVFNLGAQTASGSVSLRNDDGAALTVDLNGESVNGSKSFSIPPRGLARFVTDGLGTLQVGSAFVESNQSIDGVLLFTGSLGLAGVGNSQPITSAERFVAPIRVAPPALRTGIAFMGSPGVSGPIIRLELYDAAGQYLADTLLMLEAEGHTALFIDELVWNPPVDLTNFAGTVIGGGTESFAAMVILQTPEEVGTLPVTKIK